MANTGKDWVIAGCRTPRERQRLFIFTAMGDRADNPVFYGTTSGEKWTCPDLVDTLLCYGLAQRILFVLSRRSVAQVRVQAYPVIEHLNVFEY